MLNFEEFLNKKHFALLDGIRAMAILAVLWHHSGGRALLNWSLNDRGYLGVDLFFVLSGFLITHLLIKEKRIHGEISLKKFYIRRALRIFPLYYGFLAALMILAVVSNSAKLEQMWSALPYYVFYLSNWMPADEHHFFHRAWSLAVEEQFYFVWPLMVVVLGFWRPAIGIVLLVISSFVAIVGLFGPGGFEVNQLLVPYRTILLGCLVAILLNREGSYGALVKGLGHPVVAPALLLALIVFVALQDGRIMGLPQLVVHVLMAGFLIANVVNEQNFLGGVLRLRLMQLLGITSYGIYILHGQFWGVTQSVLDVLPGESLSRSREAFFVVCTAFSLLFAWISFNTYERYFLSLKKRFEVK